jgi:hypothetical protein
MALTPKELAELARECMARSAKMPQPERVAEDARAVLQYLVRPRLHYVDVDQVDETDLQMRRMAIRLIRRALKVDMRVPANRKGELPRALGLVGRAAKATTVEHFAIVMMMNRLRDYSAEDGSFPYSSKRKAADAVVEGFYVAGIDRRLKPENVGKIYERYWKNVG